MKSRAELRCYYCGHAAGQIESELGRSLQEATLLLPTTGPGAVRTTAGTIRCGRCGGPLFMDEAEVVRYALPFFEDEPAPRRGRPPRVLVASKLTPRGAAAKISA